MAVAFFGREVGEEELYVRTESIGAVHYTLPWGVCLGAASLDLHAMFFSRNPTGLLDSSRADIAAHTGCSVVAIEAIERSQIERCRSAGDRIRLLRWKNDEPAFPSSLVESGRAVVIPTLWWGNQPHNVVVVEVEPATVVYHDPSLPNGNSQRMARESFALPWQHVNTDQDPLVVSDSRLEFEHGAEVVNTARAVEQACNGDVGTDRE